MTSIWTGAQTAYAGWSRTKDQAVEGQNTWYHLSMDLPSGSYAPTTGEWNDLAEWHDDGHTAPTSDGPYSIYMGIDTDYPVVNGAVGQNPHLVLRLAGGNSGAPTYQTIELPAPLLYDHWYDMSFHFIWDTDAQVGLVEWYVDGVQVVSEPFPTLYTNPDGTQSYNTFGIYDYRLAAPWSSTVDFSDVAIGPTRTSVGG